MFFSPGKNLIFCTGNEAKLKGFKIYKQAQSEIFESFNTNPIYSVALNDTKIFVSKE